ncbi:peptidase [Nitrosopumilus sp.]|uniref:peptidase n=1 Tax=Nitrosopumilus sp. TaxID=2024843 RepID=UPI00247DBABB|nr:peptidase [Nitrosopumilus sp.]MCV0430907.1 peptidase [Nitrosopumilus sp.]
MRNQHLDSKILSTLSSVSQQTISVFLGLFFILLLPTIVYADVFIPDSEYTGYYDYEGIYTVVGNVKNQNDFALIPIITISVIDNDQTKITHTLHHVPIPAMTDIPFKLKFPEIHGKHPVLLNAELEYFKTEKNPVPIQIVYDKTLITYEDGHVTGRIKNIGNQTVYNPKVFAIVHGYEKYILDVAQNIRPIEKIEPGQILNFTIYPDPSVSEPVRFYSCFAPVDTTVIPITTKKNGGDFDFRYDSGAWYSAAKFDEAGTTLSIKGYNSYPLETYANFEFPPISGNEKFVVTLNDKPIEFIQSVDEMGFWHVAFNIEPTSQGILKISGFEKGLPPELPKIPQWIKNNAQWWVTDQITDSEFLEGIDFLFEKQIVSVPERDVISESQWNIPSWAKTSVSWWYEEKITDDEFLNFIENLVKRKIVVI